MVIFVGGFPDIGSFITGSFQKTFPLFLKGVGDTYPNITCISSTKAQTGSPKEKAKKPTR